MGERCRVFRCRKWNQTLNSHSHYTAILILSAVLIGLCSAQGGRDDVDVVGSRNSPCLPEKYLVPLRATFQKLIPTFNSRSRVIQLKSDARIQIGPEDSKLVPFLRSYYPTVIKELKKTTPPNKLTQSAMLLYFNTEYGRFLAQAGVPISCLSYFMGVTDVQEAMQLQQLSQSLQKRFKVEGGNLAAGQAIFGAAVTGQEIVKLLKIKQTVAFTPSEYLKDKTRDQEVCEEILLYLKDGSIMIKLPISNLEMKSMYIPSFKSSLQLGQVEVPYQLGRYISTGLNCLDRTEEKKNFIEKVLEWTSTKLIPQIVQRPTCLRGFGGILPFIVSIQEYEDTLDLDLHQNKSLLNSTYVANFTTTFPPTEVSTTTEGQSSNEIHIRRRRSLDGSEKRKRSVNTKHKHKKKKRQTPPGHKKSSHGSQPSTNQKQVGIPLNMMQSKGGANTGSQSLEKLQMDQELVHFYNKLNNRFLPYNMKIGRLDIIRLPEHKHKGNGPFPPVIFHSTTTRATTAKTTPTRRKTTTTTSTTTTTTSTSTTTTKPPPYVAPPFPVAPISNVRVIGEVRLDENRLTKPVSVVVHGKKFNAHLNVVPKGTVHNTKGEVINFEDSPFNKDPHQTGPHYQHGRHLHPRDPDKIRPLHLRKHVLYKQYARDSQPHNVVDKFLNDGVQSIANFAHSLVPAIFTEQKHKKLPKMHKFDNISPAVLNYVEQKGMGPGAQQQPQLQEMPQVPSVERPSKHIKGRRLNSVESGLENLIRADEAFPPR